MFDAKKVMKSYKPNTSKTYENIKDIYVFKVSRLPKTIKKVYKNEDIKKDGFGIGKIRILIGFFGLWPPFGLNFGNFGP